MHCVEGPSNRTRLIDHIDLLVLNESMFRLRNASLAENEFGFNCVLLLTGIAVCPAVFSPCPPCTKEEP